MLQKIKMKFNSDINLPQKSIFGFKILSSFQSSLSCYLLLLIGRFLNPLFGFNQLQLVSGALFNIVLNISILILIINIIFKRKQIKIFYFILLNSFLYVKILELILSDNKSHMFLFYLIITNIFFIVYFIF